MKASEFLKLNLMGYKDDADIVPVKDNFEIIDEAFRKITARVEALERRAKTGYIYFGTSRCKCVTEKLVKDLGHIVSVTDDCIKAVVSPEQEYVYFAFPTALGKVQFQVGPFIGGFVEPVVCEVDGEDYFVYRSDRVLNFDDIKINVIRRDEVLCPINSCSR